MRKVQIQEIYIKTFKGAHDLRVTMNGNDMVIRGKNEAGKSTIEDAYFWVFDGKDQHNSTKPPFKRIENSEVVHHVPVDVTVTLICVDGHPRTFRRQMIEKWTQHTGSATASMTGHETKYEIGGAPMSKEAFEKQVVQHMGTANFRELSDVYYFNEIMSWQERRSRIFEVIGEITDADVIASEPALSDLPQILGIQPMHEYRAKLVSSKKKLNEELDSLPHKIGELKALVVDTTWTDADSIDLEAAKAAVQTATDKRAEAKNSDGALKIKADMQRVREHRDKLKADALTEHTRAKMAAEGESLKKKQAVRMIELDQASNNANIDAFTRRKNELHEHLTKLRTEHLEIDKREFVYAEGTVCRYCGGPLSAEKLAEINAEAIAVFNSEKAESLKRNVEAGTKARAAYDDVVSRLEKENGLKEELETKMRDARAAQEAAENALQGFGSPPTEIEGVNEAEAELTRLQGVLDSSAPPDLSQFDDAVNEAQAVVTELTNRKAAAEQTTKARGRIAELEAQEKSVLEQFQDAERELALCDMFVRAKASKVTAAVNSNLSYATFLLFEDLITVDSLRETCICCVNGVPYDGVNTGSQIVANLDVLGMLSRHADVSLPVFLDNAERLTQPVSVDGQFIRLYADASADTLVFETQ